MRRAFPLFLLLACVSLCAQTATPHRSVVVISLDGFPASLLTDPKSPIPTLRKLMATGATARHMTTVNPTVTWPNHTAMVTGVDAARHGLLVNGTLVRTGSWPPVRVEPWIPQPQMVHVPTIYDAVHDAGLTTAQIDWVAIKSAPSITWDFPEVPAVEGVIEQEMIRAGLTDQGSIAQFTKANILRRDQIWADAAIHILKAHQPNLMLLHFLSLDSTHHTYGPNSLAGTAAIAFLDACVARVLDGIATAGMSDRTTVMIVSDHGFKPVKNQLHIGNAIAEAGLQNEVFLPEGGFAMLYVKPEHAAATIATLRQKLAVTEGVAEVAGPERFPALGLPLQSADPQMADLMVYPKPGYAFAAVTGSAVSTPVPSTSGAHGYLNTDPELDAIFIASGPGIKPGVVLERMRNVDVAPTIGSVLGVKMNPDISGRTLTDILK